MLSAFFRFLVLMLGPPLLCKVPLLPPACRGANAARLQRRCARECRAVLRQCPCNGGDEVAVAAQRHRVVDRVFKTAGGINDKII